MKIYIIPGYGTPTNIFKDNIYQVYLKHIGNEIFKFSINHPKTKTVVIFSGGNTDVAPPYKRTEADEMSKLFFKLFPSLKTRHIKYYLEQQSLSSLENQIYSKKIIDRIESKNKNITLFCEKTRVPRIKKTTKIIFSKVKIVGLSLPLNKQVVDKHLVTKKEDLVTKYSLWALESKSNLKKFRKVFKDKFNYLRKYPAHKQDEALIAWWKNSVDSDTKLNEK